jgi:hypothetical protein
MNRNRTEKDISDLKKRGRQSDSSDSPSPSSVKIIPKKTKGDQNSLQSCLKSPTLSQESAESNPLSSGIKQTENMESIVNEIKALRSEMRSIVKEELEPLDRLVTKVCEMEKTVTELKTKLNVMEISDRKRNIIVYGYEEKRRETWLDIDTKLEDLRRKIGFAKNIDYDSAFRLGKKQMSKSRPILLKLIRLKDKFEILNAAKKLRGTNIYIHQDLSPEDRKINAILRTHLKEIKQHNPDAKCRILINRRELLVTIKGKDTKYHIHENMKLVLINSLSSHRGPVSSQQDLSGLTSQFSSPME